MSTPSTPTHDGDEPFTLTSPASPDAVRLLGGPQGDQPAGAVARVFLQRGGRISGPSDLVLAVHAIPYFGTAAVQIELHEREPTTQVHRVLTVIVASTLLVTDCEFRRADWAELILARLCRYANALYRDRAALVAGEEFIRERIDYSKPEHAIALLRARGCEIHDEPALRRLVERDPGPLFYGSIDLDEHGDNWAHGGGRWLDRIQRQAREAGALSRKESEE
jgi:hypothetical protein